MAYFAVVAPFVLFSPGYRTNAFLAQHTEKMFYMTLKVTAVEGISVFVFLYFLILFVADKLKNKQDSFFSAGLLLLLSFYATSHYHPQWFLWVTPFLIWLFLKKKYLPVLVFCFGFFIHLIFFESSLHFGLLSPVIPIARETFEVKKISFFDAILIKNLTRSLFAACFAYLFLTFSKNEN